MNTPSPSKNRRPTTQGFVLLVFGALQLLWGGMLFFTHVSERSSPERKLTTFDLRILQTPIANALLWGGFVAIGCGFNFTSLERRLKRLEEELESLKSGPNQ
jgi:hypothetical protein